MENLDTHYSDTTDLCEPAKFSATIKALRSPYCALTEDDEEYNYPFLYFLMTNELEILGITDDPLDAGEHHCVAICEHEFVFIVEYGKIWGGAKPHYWELEIYRTYYKARMRLYDIVTSHTTDCSTQHEDKMTQLLNLN